MDEGCGDLRVVDFNLPASVKSRHKIKTPSLLFFHTLNRLLRNCESVEYFVIYRFTLTDSFVEKYLRHVYSTPSLKYFRTQRVKRENIKQWYYDYLSALLLNEIAEKRF